jgi:hypothetical protein
MVIYIVLLLTVVRGGSVMAQSKTAADYYKEGTDQYTIGNFVAAVDSFKRAYELESDDANKPNYIYNIAQSYRFAKDCRQAAFFYKRFLALRAERGAKPLKPEKRADVEANIEAMEECAKTQPPDVAVPVPKPEVKTPIEGGDGKVEGDLDGAKVKPVVETPVVNRDVMFRLGGGLGFISIKPVKDIKPGLSITGSIGYVVARNTVDIDVGVGGGFSPLIVNGNADWKYALISFHAYGAARIPLNRQISIRTALTLGAAFIPGLETGNPFTTGGNPADGALTVPQATFGTALDIQVSPGFSLWLSPITFGLAIPPVGFKNDISTIMHFDATAGIGLHL